MTEKMSALAAVSQGYGAGIQPLGISRTFDENARGPVRTSDIVISATLIQAAGTTLATVPTGENWRVEHLAFRNATAGALELRVYLIPSGGSLNVTTNGVYVASVAANASVLIGAAIGYQLAAGEQLAAVAPSNNDFIAFGRLARITQGSTA